MNRLFLIFSTTLIGMMLSGCALMTPNEVIEMEEITKDVLITVEQDIDKDIHK